MIKISVIVPCYNQANFLDEALESVLRQTYENWECIIINDGSDDDTAAIAGRWVKKDDRFKYEFQENKGLSGARNKGLQLVTGNFIQFLDADDAIDLRKFENSIKAIEENLNTSIVVSNFRTFTNDLQVTYPPYSVISEELLCFNNILVKWATNSIPIHCGLFKAELFKAFRFPEDLKAVEDWVMWVSIFKDDPEFIFIDEPMAFYRRQPGSLTVNQELMDENLKKAFFYIKKIVPKTEDYMYFAFLEQQKNFREIRRLERKIASLQNQSSGSFLTRIKRRLFN
ncbi:glycosyltransferase family 2 protein [Gramella sp. MT6]|uniref:glycosyltransferase family 2 protein n=1 Tax=Gramella sp. MT6 TaxID=2705471 RepID=UPI001C5D2233|nr:glycosyltransferase family 2 protein [Gramella sp. MT6]QYA24025.1 glycosyltransferase family 2 protein [Gramella sp. MT6]